MKVLALLFLLAAAAVVYPSVVNAQAYDNNTVSARELAMPHKAMDAFNKGVQLLIKGDCQGSLTYFLRVIELAPDASYRPYHNLGLVYYRLGQFDNAEEYFQKSIDLSKGAFSPSLFGLAMILYRRADLRHAQDLIERGLLVTPGSGLGKYCLGLVQFSLGKLNDAERNALDALRLDTAQTDAYLLLAHIHERLQNPQAVIANVQSYFKLSPNHDLQADAQGLLERAQQASASAAPLAASLN
jgi:tetratricopeptide (TPR) repeat protein